MDEQETESLVNVLEELIESFKNMQNRYEGEMAEFQKTFEQYKTNYEFALNKLEEDYKQKLNTLEPIIQQLTRKDENLNYIMSKVSQLESRKDDVKVLSSQNLNAGKQGQEVKKLEAELEEKNRVIKLYQATIEKLKSKFNEKL